MTTYILAYLLTGFIFYFVAIETGQRGTESWRWNLAAIMLWPISIVVGCFTRTPAK